VITEGTGDASFVFRRGRVARQAGDHDDRPLRFLGGDPQHRLVKPRVADRELRRVHAHRQPAAAGVEVIARQRALPALVQPAACVESERMCRDHGAATQQRGDLGGQLGAVHVN
jgi:hypothetical protein